MEYEPVIGLETHAELLTESKLWCNCSTRFGQSPNSQTCPVCLGMPGVLPVMNGWAFELSLRAALALNCTINRLAFFDRKNYYYPDLPKNYQISQSYRNLGVDGHLEIPVDGATRQIGILNVHLEEDAGKNMHVQQPGADYSLVDLNRAGTPLLEIVSAPEIRSVQEADSYMQTLRQLLTYTRVSDCKMEEGSLRFEASISVRPVGSRKLGARVEIKNLNSLKAVRAAVAFEIKRQTRLLSEGGTVAQETRLWDEQRGRTARMRTKEEAHDYRYFPEPDLLPVEVSDEMIRRVRAALPELPLQRKQRFVSEYGLSDYEAGLLTGDRSLADYFEACLKTHNAPKSIANWLMNVVLALLNERKVDIEDFEISPPGLGELVELMDQGTINAQVGREVMQKMGETGKGAHEIVEEEGAQQIGDEDELTPIVEQVIAENPQPVEDYLGGKKAAVGALVGQVMRLTRGKADPKLANRLLREKLDAMT